MILHKITFLTIVACASFLMACGVEFPVGEKPELVSLAPSASTDANPSSQNRDARVSDETSPASTNGMADALATREAGSFDAGRAPEAAEDMGADVPESASTTSTPDTADASLSETGPDAVLDASSETSLTSETSAPSIGKLTVSVLLPRWGATHAITVYAYEHATGSTPSPGKWIAAGRGITFTVDAVAGSKFVWNGFYDPKTPTADDWTHAFCDWKFLTQHVAVWATFNGKPTARVKVISNLVGGCNLELIAAASPFISTSDQDGDGFSSSDPNPLMRDCDDTPLTGHQRFPGQIETPEDELDLDCDGWKDPPRAIIRMKGVSVGATPLLYDVLRWGITHAMVWEAKSKSYQTAPLEFDFAPHVFFISWGISGWDSSAEEGVCKERTGGVVMYRDTDKTLIPVALKLASSGTSCHRYAEIP